MASSIPTGTGFHLAGGGGGGGSTDALTVYASGTAGEAIAVGDVLRFDRSGGANAGRLLKAQALSATSGVAADVVGVAKTAAAGAGSAVEYFLAGSVAGAVDAAPGRDGQRLQALPFRGDPGRRHAHGALWRGRGGGAGRLPCGGGRRFDHARAGGPPEHHRPVVILPTCDVFRA